MNGHIQELNRLFAAILYSAIALAFTLALLADARVYAAQAQAPDFGVDPANAAIDVTASTAASPNAQPGDGAVKAVYFHMMISDQPDGQAPTSYVTTTITQTVGRVPFNLTWVAHDEGGGVYSITLAYKKNNDNWKAYTDTLTLSATSGSFIFVPPDDLFASPVITYSFATIASDDLGNLEPLPATPDAQVVVRQAKVYLPVILKNFPHLVVTNGDFGNGLSGWLVGGGLGALPAFDPSAPSNPVALLGSPSWHCNHGVPLDFSRLSQRIVVPQPEAGHLVRLHYRYRIFTQDRNASLGEQYDSFDVFVDGALVNRYANTTLPPICDSIHDLGWQSGVYTFTNIQFGKTLTISFAVYNRYDKYYNTYVYLDDVGVTVGP
jgi:hypothetical protein